MLDKWNESRDGKLSALVGEDGVFRIAINSGKDRVAIEQPIPNYVERKKEGKKMSEDEIKTALMKVFNSLLDLSQKSSRIYEAGLVGVSNSKIQFDSNEWNKVWEAAASIEDLSAFKLQNDDRAHKGYYDEKIEEAKQILNSNSILYQETTFDKTKSEENIKIEMEETYLEENIPRLIFIVPYRDREQQYQFFKRHMQYILEDYQSSDYRIFYIHQCDNREFNRGALKNLGFLITKYRYPNVQNENSYSF